MNISFQEKLRLVNLLQLSKDGSEITISDEDNRALDHLLCHDTFFIAMVMSPGL